MNDADFNYLAALLKDRSGLIVTPDKQYLFDTRLGPIAREHKLKDVDTLIGAMRQSRNEVLIGAVVDAMTTNETSFFRDRHPFDAMRQTILPALIRARAQQKQIRIWSAASSTGQEAYSLAIMIAENFPMLASWKIEIVGTDISPTALARAKEATFSTFEVQRGLPIQMLVKHFTQEGDRWTLKPELRKRATFQHFNLLGDLSPLGGFDVIFCRNVLIYFDIATKARVLDAMSRRLAADGALVLGGSESVFGICPKFAGVSGLRGIYALDGKQPSWSASEPLAPKAAGF
jgi:chemotaxis protein methyltransferase CheR